MNHQPHDRRETGPLSRMGRKVLGAAASDAEAREIAGERVVRFWNHTARSTAPAFRQDARAAAE